MRLPPLPELGHKRLAVRVTKDALRHLRAGHPWIYDKSITSLSHEGSAGDLAVVFDDNRRFVAIGLFDPASPMRIKVLHSGSPAQIDAGWWAGKVRAASQLRLPISRDGATTGYRVMNGENDGFPGLVADRFGSTVVVKLYSPAWLPHLRSVLGAIRDEIGPKNVLLRLSRSLAADSSHQLVDGYSVLGSGAEPVEFSEHGLRFLAHPVTGQKTGFFLDQRDNRRRVADLSGGARMLDMFSCTGAFSVAAAAGGATHVTSVDINAAAIQTVAQNLALNEANHNVAKAQCEGIVGDGFEVMERLRRDGRRFDVVVVDPPSFAQRQANVERGLKAYGRLTELAVSLVASGGVLVQASCSSRITEEQFFNQLHVSAARAGTRLLERERTGHGIDHPVAFPEGAYLKALFARVEPLS